MKKHRNLQVLIIVILLTFVVNLKNYKEKWDYQFCKDNIKLTKQKDDLLNPLSKTFRRLLKGFCIKNARNGGDENNNGPTNDEEKKDLDSLYKISVDGETPYWPLDYKFPILLPSGKCSDSLIDPVYLLQNKNVTCKMKTDTIKKIVGDTSIIPKSAKSYVLDKYNKIIEKKNEKSSLARHIKVIYLINNGTEDKVTSEKVFQIYYYNDTLVDKDKEYLTITFEAVFIEINNGTKYSGNYGYIRTHPIIFGNSDQVFKLPRLFNRLVYSDSFGVCDNITGNNTLNGSFVYYDINFDPSITFEDTIIYGCLKENFPSQKIKDLTEGLNISKFGKFTQDDSSWLNINKNNLVDGNANLFGLYFYTARTGKVNNYHNIILSSRISQINIETNNQVYFIVKSFKREYKKKWFEPKPPGVEKMPWDVMYPFKSYSQT